MMALSLLPMFEWMESWFEPPTDDELYGAMIVCDS